MDMQLRKWARTARLTRRKWPLCLFLIAWASVAFANGASVYEVRFRNVPQWGMRSLLEQGSDSYALRNYPPPTETLLRRRADRDLPAIMTVLQSAGYYAAQPAVELVTSAPRRVVFHLNPGPRYRLGAVVVQASAIEMPALRHFGWKPGRAAAAAPLLAAEEECLAYVRSLGYPFPQWTRRIYTPDHERRVLNVELKLDPGPKALWGKTSITGLVSVKERFVQNELELPEGKPFNPAQLTETRTRLIRLGLFSAVNLTTAEEVDDEGRLPLSLTLRERRPRTVAAGVKYTTDEGYGTRLEWEHRNLFTHAERLHLTLDVGESVNAFESRFTVPQFGEPRQRLLLNARVADEHLEAYDSKSVKTLAQLEREWRQIFWLRGGVGFQLSDVGQFDEDKNYVFLTLPFELDWNTSRDPLDPRRGHRVFAHAEPFYDLERKDRAFLKSSVTLNKYQRLNHDRTWLLAGRVTAGGISGESSRAVPADERFYAGGGSSVRGYAYQKIGPLQDGDPLGGRSLFEASGELRAQVMGNFGFVFFLDGGTAFRNTDARF
ncbi:MAG: BamA/TamA family outer membrane protein [Kiritimatiellae bacterium]|nr:BamA/TamA family outer membrane protein [Kiritimatiellia bacterium]